MNKVKDFLYQTQNIAYQTLANSFANKRISHAYLINGAMGTPLIEMAIYLAQSYLCSELSPLACEQCVNCLRIEDRTYPDLIIIDGEKESIKKAQVEEIQRAFFLESLEEAGKKIYIIHLLENATPGAVNSLLKFIEEPVEDVIAIFTTQNITKILPTVISRCQVIRLKNYNPNKLREAILNLGYQEEDAYILSYIFTNIKEVETYLENEEFHIIKDLAFETMYEMGNHKDVFNFLQGNVYNKIYDKGIARKYLDIIEYILKDVIRIRNHQEIEFKNHQQLIEKLDKKIKDANQSLKIVILARGNIETNANIPLLLDRLFYHLEGGV